MPVTSIGFIRDTTLLLRDIISGNITDPVSNRQQQSGDTGSNARFIMTSWPQRFLVYPFITIGHITSTDLNLGISTEDAQTKSRYQIDIWTKQIGQRDGLTGSLYSALRTAQLGTSSLTGSELFDFRLANIRTVDEDGKAGTHRAIVDVELSFIHTT